MRKEIIIGICLMLVFAVVLSGCTGGSEKIIFSICEGETREVANYSFYLVDADYRIESSALAMDKYYTATLNITFPNGNSETFLFTGHQRGQIYCSENMDLVDDWYMRLDSTSTATAKFELKK